MSENKEQVEEKEKERISQSLPATTTSMERYLAEISNYPVLSREEEYELAKRYKETGDLEAARKLITSNLKFVIRVANEYKNYGLNIMDLIQEGNIGLMQAVKRFDPTKGYRLISYAVWWIRAYIQNYIMRSWKLVKLGTTQGQRKLFYKLRSTKQKMDMTDEVLSPEDYENLADELGVSEEEVIEMDQRMGSRDVSLDTQIKEKGETSYLDFLEDEMLNQEEMLTKAQEEEEVKKGLEIALQSLKDRERYIIKNRILRDNPLTLEELGKELNLSRERVRQIESEALKKMRGFFEKKES
ncbi:MAG TPA: RNA polymerase sigma factor RpoH [Thermodesulfobacteriota bacterium]|nr:RNA polymerase sigma factor RpoH [Thermodesulfobacteriota bacterium]